MTEDVEFLEIDTKLTDSYKVIRVMESNKNKNNRFQIFVAQRGFVRKGEAAVKFKVGIFSLENHKILPSYKVFAGGIHQEHELRMKALDVYNSYLKQLCVRVPRK